MTHCFRPIWMLYKDAYWRFILEFLEFLSFFPLRFVNVLYRSILGYGLIALYFCLLYSTVHIRLLQYVGPLNLFLPMYVEQLITKRKPCYRKIYWILWYGLTALYKLTYCIQAYCIQPSIYVCFKAYLICFTHVCWTAYYKKKALLSQEIGVIGKSRGFHRLHLVVRPKCDQITFKFSDDFRIPKCGKEHHHRQDKREAVVKLFTNIFSGLVFETVE